MGHRITLTLDDHAIMGLRDMQLVLRNLDQGSGMPSMSDTLNWIMCVIPVSEIKASLAKDCSNGDSTAIDRGSGQDTRQAVRLAGRTAIGEKLRKKGKGKSAT